MRKEYSQTFLQQIIDLYHVIGSIQEISLFTSGFENSNYYVKTDKGEYVIKVYEGMGMTKENILFEIDMMVHCMKNNLKIPFLFQTKEGLYYVAIDGKIAIVMNYIDGENLFKKAISDAVIVQIGEEAGKMNNVLCSFSGAIKTRENYEWDLKNFLLLEKLIKLLPEEFDKQFIQSVFDDFRKIQDDFIKCPTGLIHNDVAAHNILAKGDELKAIIDFSDAALSPYIQNVAVFLSQTVFTYNWAPHQIKLFLQGYQKHRAFSQDELDLLYDLVKARFATVIVEFNRWNVEYDEDKQRVDYIRDCYRFLERFSQISREEFKRLLENRVCLEK